MSDPFSSYDPSTGQLTIMVPMGMSPLARDIRAAGSKFMEWRNGDHERPLSAYSVSMLLLLSSRLSK